jgi:uncharacterized protein YbjT (DUF2867 family)
MPTFAMMSGNTVETIIMADDKQATEAALRCTLIEYTAENPAGVGWSYDPETGKFIEPVVEELSDPQHSDISGGSEVGDLPTAIDPII